MPAWKQRLVPCGLALVSIGLLAGPAALGQSLAVVKSRDIAPYNQAIEGFATACGLPYTLYELAEEASRSASMQRLKTAKPALVLSVGALATQLVQDTLDDVPTVFCMVPNPYRFLTRGKKITGVSLDIPIEQQFATYKALVPTLRTLGTIADPHKTGAMAREASLAAGQLGLHLLAPTVTSQKEVPAAWRGLLGKIEAFWMLPDDTVITPDSFKFLLLETLKNNLPFLATSDIFVKAGALASLSPDYSEVGRQACHLTRQLQQGHWPPAAAAVVPPAKVQLAINLTTARKIGLTLSADVLRTANQVFE